MAPKTIYYPPQPIDKNPIHECLNYNDLSDTLTIVFNHRGELDDDNENAFTDEIREGEYYRRTTVGPLSPNKTASQVKLVYHDEENGDTYEYDVTIQATAC